MNEESSPIDPEVLRTLRNDACAPVPRVARERVSARLLAAGVGAVAGASAVVSIAPPAKAAGSGAAQVSGKLASSALVKSVIGGIVLVAGAGTYAAHRARGPELPRAAVTVARASGASTFALPAPSAAVPSPVAPIATVALETLAPLAELPQEPARSAGAGSAAIRLAEQQALLDAARAALRAGDAALALATLLRHRAAFPQTAFDEERRALEIRALVASGRSEEARERLTSFERRFGRSLQLSSLRRTVTGAERTVTDSATPSESHQYDDDAR